MTNGLGMMIDGVVAFLLILTIGFCLMLNRRLKMLKADEQSLRATISELVTATEIAERAVNGLKLTVHECDMGLGERLRKAERVTIEIDRAVVSGKDLVSRLSQIVSAGRRPDGPLAPIDEPQPAELKIAAAAAGSVKTGEIKTQGAKITDAKITNAKAVAVAAEAFAERLRSKVHGLAA
jgi:hypothetical protein